MTQGVFYNNSSHCLPPVEPMTAVQIGNKTQSPVTASNRYSSGYAQASWNPIRVLGEQHRPLSSYPVMPMPPNTHVPYPYLSLPPDPPPIDPLGWQWQPPPSHYPLQISPVSTHHNGYMQGPTVSHQTSGQFHVAWFHAPTSVKFQAAQTIPSIRSQSISPPRTSTLPMKVDSLYSTVPTYASHSSSASALVTKDALTENPLNQLATRCRNFVLSIGSRDHPEWSPKEWIKLVSQLDAILVLQRTTSSEVSKDGNHSASAVVIIIPKEHKQDLDMPKL
ncbi:hypothetical protein EV360DRAFT_85280 [Lentinula raphanica]|nr:hypothetical protein EV360DRAFT_85280 [Lentinula raphanica]